MSDESKALRPKANLCVRGPSEARAGGGGGGGGGERGRKKAFGRSNRRAWAEQSNKRPNIQSCASLLSVLALRFSIDLHSAPLLLGLDAQVPTDTRTLQTHLLI